MTSLFPSIPLSNHKKIFLHTLIVWKKIHFLVSYKVAELLIQRKGENFLDKTLDL